MATKHGKVLSSGRSSEHKHLRCHLLVVNFVFTIIIQIQEHRVGSNSLVGILVISFTLNVLVTSHLDTPLEFCWHQYFSPEISNFFYIGKYIQKLHCNIFFPTLLIFIESIKVVLINMVTILMISAKLTSPDLGILK